MEKVTSLAPLGVLPQRSATESVCVRLPGMVILRALFLLPFKSTMKQIRSLVCVRVRVYVCALLTVIIRAAIRSKQNIVSLAKPLVIEVITF